MVSVSPWSDRLDEVTCALRLPVSVRYVSGVSGEMVSGIVRAASTEVGDIHGINPTQSLNLMNSVSKQTLG